MSVKFKSQGSERGSTRATKITVLSSVLLFGVLAWLQHEDSAKATASHHRTLPAATPPRQRVDRFKDSSRPLLFDMNAVRNDLPHALAKALAVDSPSLAEIEAQYIKDEEEAEDELMRREDNVPEQRAMRLKWVSETEDEAWTEAMAEEVVAKIDNMKVAPGDFKMYELSCRETVCRYFLEFKNLKDAQGLVASAHDSSIRYEYQPLLPEIEDEGDMAHWFEYEVLVVRPKSAVP